MGDKMIDTRFTIQFSRTDPSHLQVAEILNRQGRRSKAQYIVAAVLHYESCTENPNIQHTPGLDIKVIEAVVNRILMSKEDKEADAVVALAPIKHSKKLTSNIEKISFDDAIEVLGEDGFNAVASTLNMFRRKSNAP
jgi:MoxR-like ATPase